jgi:class 3 adenylate cyclase
MTTGIKVASVRWTIFVLKTGSRLLKLYLAFFLLAFGLSLIKNVERYPIVVKAIEVQSAVERPMIELIRENLPFRLKGRDMSQVILFVVFMAVWILLDGKASRLQLKLGELKHENWKTDRKQTERIITYEPEAMESSPTVSFSGGAAAGMPLRTEGASIPRADKEGAHSLPKAGEKEEAPQKLDREKLLEIYARTKRALEDQKKQLFFLSLDVVDSTGMKQGEDSEVAERDFRQYRKFVQKAIQDHNGIKAAWTPDGVMICFPTSRDAVQAAKQVLTGLGHFNRRVKSIVRDFRVRAGINDGRILFDESIPLEEVSDRQIDIAGHMQKHAEPDTIYVSKEVVDELPDGDGFSPAGKSVDGREVYCWKKGEG